jgi:hypothetical protein
MVRLRQVLLYYTDLLFPDSALPFKSFIELSGEKASDTNMDKLIYIWI